jgi:2-dehydro-3-deoxygluconokinase
MSADVLTVGEVMACLRPERAGPLRLGGRFGLTIAGAESNVAIGLSRLGHRVTHVGRVGDDELGELVRRTLRAEGVAVSGLATDHDAPTGLMLVEARTSAVTRVHYRRSGSAGSRLTAADVLPAVDGGPRILYVSGVTPALSASARAAVLAAVHRAVHAGVRVCLDVNYRSALWTRAEAAECLRPLALRCDVLVASSDELDLALAPGKEDDFAAFLSAGPDRRVVITRGADGASLLTRNGKVEAPALPVPVVDTIGAGDAFVAGLLSAVLDGQAPAACLSRGLATASFVVSTTGDWEGLPTRRDLTLAGVAHGTTVR